MNQHALADIASQKQKNTAQAIAIQIPSHQLWRERDFAVFDEPSTIRHMLGIRRMPVWIVLAIIIGIITGTRIAAMQQQTSYTHLLRENQTWITTQGQAQRRCIVQAATPEALAACRMAATDAIAVREQAFSRISVPDGYVARADQMLSAFDALSSAMCPAVIDPRQIGQCLPALDVRLELSQLNAQDALGQ